MRLRDAGCSDAIAEFHEYPFDLSIKFAVILTGILLLSHNFLRTRFRHVVRRALKLCGTLCKFRKFLDSDPTDRTVTAQLFFAPNVPHVYPVTGGTLSVKSRRCNRNGFAVPFVASFSQKGLKVAPSVVSFSPGENYRE